MNKEWSSFHSGIQHIAHITATNYPDELGEHLLPRLLLFAKGYDTLTPTQCKVLLGYIQICFDDIANTIALEDLNMTQSELCWLHDCAKRSGIRAHFLPSLF